MSADELNSNAAYKHKITEELLKMVQEYNNKTVNTASSTSQINKQSQQIHKQMYMLANKYAAELGQNVVVIPAAAVSSPEQKNLADYRNYMIAAAIGR
uniref:Uncharacterized protein n=1 Tax=Ditylenchus dipsaci TaxID=166011 RepID=A0A915EPS7_9BILA